MGFPYKGLAAFVLSLLLAGFVLCSGGCQMDSAQRIAMLESVVTQMQAVEKVAVEQVATLRAQLDAAQQAGAASATLAKITAALDEALTRKTDVETVLATARDKLQAAKLNPTIGGEIETYLSLGVGALGVFLSAYFKRKGSTANAALTQHRDTLSTLTTAVEGLPVEVQAAVKTAVSRQMALDSEANAVIDRIKKAS